MLVRGSVCAWDRISLCAALGLEGLTFRTEEFAGDVEGFAADYDYFLAHEELFCDCAGQTTQQVAFAVHHDLCSVSVLCSARYIAT